MTVSPSTRRTLLVAGQQRTAVVTARVFRIPVVDSATLEQLASNQAPEWI